ncbi:hypothetical protein JEQ12_002045 [Ovis aries]|uniref:Uncharacterized protein n=1 Tax=Ovis aries TaxID=9940 RepID=A0A836A8B4_SHEEP|nr:hypothetical protein JEQ12_002045 [Ovis aries]
MIPHASEHLSPRATLLGPRAIAVKPECPRACAPQQEKPPQRKRKRKGRESTALVLQLESNPCSPQLEKAPAQQLTTLQQASQPEKSCVNELLTPAETSVTSVGPNRRSAQ